MVWVRTGAARVEIDGAMVLRLAAGQGVLIPAEGWNHRAIVTDPCTIAFPLWPDTDAGWGAEPTRFEVPDGWQNWLIQCYALQTNMLVAPGYSPDGVVDRLRQRLSGRRPMSSPNPSPVRATVLDTPALPKSRGSRKVAEELIRNPAAELTVQQWASRAMSSPRTLLRNFHSETGLSFTQWRRRHRLHAAIELMGAGIAFEQIAARVGFATRNGLAKAFRQEFGLTLQELREQLSEHFAMQRDVAVRQDEGLRGMARGGDVPDAAPELLPAGRTPLHTNDAHVLTWMCRGSGYLDIGDHRYELERGAATWVPAGVEHTNGIRENSISLPLSWVGADEFPLTGLLQAQFSPAWDDYLMFSALSFNSVFRPDDYDARRVILNVFEDQLTAQRALSVPMPTDPRARAVALHFLRTIEAASSRSDFELSSDLHRVFREETGMTFARWRTVARMRLARGLLADGVKPSAVARCVGYRHLSNFSAAFSQFHGIAPRDYQERESAKP